MTLFKTLDLRGMHFSNSFDLTLKALSRLRPNGILEILFDQKRNFTEAFRRWAQSHGHRLSDVENEGELVRLFIKKGTSRS